MSAPASSNRRLALLVLVALGLWYFRDSFTTDTPAVRKPTAKPVAAASPARSVRVAPPEDICTVPTSLPTREALVAKAKANPFMAPAPAPAKLPKPIKTVVPVVAAVAPPPPQASAPLPPPKLPFTYIGQFVDPGRPTTVFLTQGNALLNAHPGDTVEGGFRLESIGPRELVFLHVARNITLRMPIEGERL